MDLKTELPTCDLCSVIFYSDKMKEDHLHGKKHLMAVHQANSIKVKEECGIFVTGLPNMVPKDQLIGLFETYGKVVSNFFGENNRFCIIQFDSPEPAENLIKLESIFFKGKKLKICRRAVKEREAAKAVFTSPVENFDEIISTLKHLPTFDAQLKYLIDKIQPSYQETRNKICALVRDLQGTLFEQFPDCEIYTFGSTITNLYLQNSDIDIYVKVYNYEKNSSPNTTMAATCVNTAKKLLSKYGHIFGSVCGIPHAKTPIVKFLHTPTNIKCDFNFKNMLGVCNSQLIHYYLLLNHKLTPTMIFIKYWAKVHELIGLGGKFSSYSLALMFIFYMQRSIYKFPPVVVLQTHNCISMQDGWNGGFQRIPTYSKLLAEHSLRTVLLGFFEFYSNFDYTLNIISPYVGKTISKTEFIQLDTLPSYFMLYKNNVTGGKLPLKVESSICVQDPFELNHNVSVGVNADYLEEFVDLCKIAVSFLQDTSQEDEAIFKLLTEEPEVFARKAIANDAECRFKILLSNTLLQLNSIVSLKKEVENGQKQSEIVRVWQDELKTTMLKVLKDIMMFTIVSDNEDKRDDKAQRRLGQKDIHDKVNASYQCCGFYNLWDGHKTIMKDINIDNSTPLFEQQLALKKYILDILYRGNVLNERIIEFNIKLTFNESLSEATFYLRNIRSKPGYFKKFGLYFLKMLPLLFQAHLTNIVNTLCESDKVDDEQKS